MRNWIWAIIGVWALQIATLIYFFANLTWENYWFCRWLYRPALRLFTWAGEGILPGHFFSPFDRRGVLTGFAFASLTYAILTIATYHVGRRLALRR